MNYDYECLEITALDDYKIVYVSGNVEYDVEDGAVGYVPYGDTEVWHPGSGDSIEFHEVVIDEILDDEGCDASARFKHYPVWMKQLEEAIKEELEQGDSLIDHAKKCAEDDEASRADDARKERELDDE